MARENPDVTGASLADELTRRGRPVSTRSGQRYRARALDALAEVPQSLRLYVSSADLAQPRHRGREVTHHLLPVRGVRRAVRLVLAGGCRVRRELK